MSYKKIKIISSANSHNVGMDITKINKWLNNNFYELEAKEYFYPWHHFTVTDPFDGNTFDVMFDDCIEIKDELYGFINGEFPLVDFDYTSNINNIHNSKKQCCNNKNIVMNTAYGKSFYVCRSCKKETDKEGYV
jgi:hypothetical protein